MAIQKPLVIQGGSIQQLSASDQLAGVIHSQRFASGRNFSIALNQAASSTTAQGNNSLRAWPFWVLSPVTIVNLRMQTNTAVASSQMRVGLYADNGQGYPGNLVAGSDVAALDGTVPGVKINTFASAITLTPGLYWQVHNSINGINIRTIAVSALNPLLGNSAAMGANSANTHLAIGSTYAALPAIFPASAVVTANGAAPLVLYTVQ